MTFNKAAWAIDGATVNSALARTEAFAANSGNEGVVQGSDLKVTALGTPGNGVQIAVGAATVLNKYQTVPNQLYTVVNPSVHTIGSGDMPASTAGANNYIVCVSIGDPEFSQSGHPWMTGSDPTPGTESTFTYVRPIVILESAFNARTFPAVALARIVRPGSTTTITSGMITDLRSIPRPRTLTVQGVVSAPGGADPLNSVSPTTEKFPNASVLSVTIPIWAKKATIMGFIEGLTIPISATGSRTCSLVPQIEGTALVGNATSITEGATTVAERRSYNMSGVIDVSSIAGTVKTFSVKGSVAAAGSVGMLIADAPTQIAMTVVFEETVV